MDTKHRSNRAHVLVLPYPAQGHINPMLQFSKRLVSKGLKATLATTVYIASSISSQSGPTSSNIDVETFSDGFDHAGFAAAKSVQEYLTSLQLFGSRTLANLIKKLDDLGHPVSAIIYDGFMPWAFDVAKQFGLTKVLFFTQTCAVNNIYYHVYTRILPVPLLEPTVKIPGLPTLEHSEVPSFVKEPESHPAYYDLVVNGQFSNVDEADWVLYSTFYKLEEKVVDWVAKAKLWRLRTVGPMVPSMYLDKRLEDDKDYGINMFKPKADACKNWLNSKPISSVVYVSFGSMAGLDLEQTGEMASFLKESDYFFLWVVRETEQSKLPDRFVEEASGKGLVVTWSPQLEVLAHESIGCFVSHCGLNSVLEALSLGVPVVAMPQWTDQRTNAKYLEDVWGTGMRVWPDENGTVRRRELERCVKEIMEGERGKVVKKNAIKWRNLAKEATGEAGSSDKNIDEFVASL